MKLLLTNMVNNRVLANLLMIMILFTGIISSILMVREEMPNVSFDIVQVEVTYPGADPEEVEEGVSRKIEEKLKGMEGLKSYTSVSRENGSITRIEIKDGYNGREVLDRVRTEIDGISTFPSDAEKPIITLPLHRDPVMALYLNGDLSEKALKEWAQKLKDQLLNLDQISQVTITGIRDYEVDVEVSEQKLREYGITFSQVTEAIRRSSLNRSGGQIRNKLEDIRIRTVGRKYTGKSISSIVVLAGEDGEIITLDTLAVVKDGFTEDMINTSVNGSSAILLNIYKTKREDSISISEAVHDFIADQNKKLPPGANVGILFDNTDSIRHQMNVLFKNGIIGLITVFFILWLFLNARLSFWTGLGIVVSVFGGLAITWLVGGSINNISIFGFIMILGIVTDDAIVVGESIAWHRKQGAGPVESAINGFLEVGMPVTAGVMTTILAFIPLIFVGGVMGKFIRILPIVVIACLVVSLLECFLILPAHLAHSPDKASSLRKPSKTARAFNIIPNAVTGFLDYFILKFYTPTLKKTLSVRYAVLSLTVALLLVSMGLIKGNLIKFEMLPERDGRYITSIVKFPEGTSIDVTKEAVKKLEQSINSVSEQTRTNSGEPLIKEILVVSGQTPGLEPGRVEKTAPHIGGVQVMLLDAQNRGIHTKELVAAWKKEVGAIYGATSLSFTGTIMGHPGKPIEIGVDGHNLEFLKAAVNDLTTKLGRFEGIFDIQSDFTLGKNEIQFKLKPEARVLGITVQDLANQLYTGYYGEEALRIQRGSNEVKIRVRYTSEERQRLSSLDHFRIRTSQGYEVPLNRVAETSYGPGFSSIIRTDGFRRVTVSADVDTSIIRPGEIISELENGYFEMLETKYPGISLVLEGEAGESEESFDSMIIGFIIIVLAIFMLIAALFRSYLQPLIVLITIPFGIIGALWGHFILGYDLTMISFFGIVGLTGIVINDAIVLIEQVNKNMAEGIPFFEAVQKGGTRRFRAVFLTSITTVGGLAPLILESDAYASTLIPMAITIVFGVVFATILTLLLIPCLLCILNDFRLFLNRMVTGTWSDRLEVEPAFYRNRSNQPQETVGTPQTDSILD